MEGAGLKLEDGNASHHVLRLFVAISVPENVKDEIEKAQKELRAALPGKFVRWTKRERFHLTLKFLGSVAESHLAGLIEALRVACLDFTMLRLRAERIGFFPDMQFPRVVWTGVQDGEDTLPQLQQAVETAVKNFTLEKPGQKFAGHVTLGRIQSIKRPQAEILAKQALSMADKFFGEWAAEKIELIRSELLPGGSRYTTLAAIPLSKV